MKTQDLLFEIGTEELPTKAVKHLSNSLCGLFQQQLDSNNLSYSSITPYATPRRIAFIVKELQVKQKNYTNERKGPALKAAHDKDGNFSKAALGFAKSCDTTADKLDKLETDNGSWLIFKQNVPGKSTKDLLENMLHEAIKKLPIAKPMRWATHDYNFARPVHWVILLFGKEVINATIFGKQTGNISFGHRFLSPGPITIENPTDYEQALADKYVVANFNTRLNNIKSQVNEIALSKTFTPIMPSSLLEEVTSLVEWPVALLAEFDQKFLSIPQECLITSMVNHQKYFALTDSSNRIQPSFIFISNIESKDPKQVINGNKRVLSARLADAEFFFNNDKKQRLDERIPSLANITYQQKLGSLLDKTTRVEKLSIAIASDLKQQGFSLNNPAIVKSAQLAKTDLTTEMVFEFPELQGIMGKYYALNDNEDTLIADSLEQYYLPKQAGDRLPDSTEACILSIADKLDTIVGIFTIGQKPTGEKDPFGLRRAALGILRILIEKKLPLDLKSLIEYSCHTFEQQTTQKVVINKELKQSLSQDCLAFCFDRLKKYYQNKGINLNLYYSVINTKTTSPYDFDSRISAVNNFLSLPEASNLIAANKRVKNILSKQNTNDLPSDINNTILEEPAEINLNKTLSDKTATLQPLFDNKEYNNILEILAKLQTPIDAFFDNVMVMSDNQEQKNNRLLLLCKIQGLFNKVADISELQ